MIGRAAKDILIKIKADDKGFQKGIKDSDKSMGAFASKMKTHSAAIGAGFIAAAAGFIALSVKMAAAEEAVSRQTEALLKSQGVMWKSVSNELNAYMKELEELTAFNDTDLQMAFNTMIAAGMSYTEAMENMNTVTSMAYTLNRDLVSMAQLLGKAYNGQTGELSRYGIVLGDTIEKGKEVAAIQAHVNENFADAAVRTETLEGQMDLLNSELSNFAEAVGAEVIPMLTEMSTKLNETGSQTDSLGAKLGRVITSPYEFGKHLKDVNIAWADIIQLGERGIDTEAELVNWYSLRSDKLTEMSDEYFKHTMLVLELSGYEEKAMQLERSRAYGLQQEESSLQNIVNLEHNRTAELEKQLSMQQRAASLRERIKSGTSLAGLTGTAGAFASGEAYTRTSGAFTVTRASQASGL